MINVQVFDAQIFLGFKQCKDNKAMSMYKVRPTVYNLHCFICHAFVEEGDIDRHERMHARSPRIEWYSYRSDIEMKYLKRIADISEAIDLRKQFAKSK